MNSPLASDPSSGPPPILPYATPSVSVRSAVAVVHILAKLGPLVGLAAVFGLFAILSPKTFLPWDNLQIILLDSAVVGTAALGATVIIISGGIDLSVGSNIALCSVVIALALQAGFAPVTAVLIGIAASCFVGLVIGLLITQLRLIPFIVTLGMLGAVRGTAKQLTGETEIYPDFGQINARYHAEWMNNLMRMLDAKNQWMVLPIGVWAMLLLTIFVAGILRYTRFGRHVYAIGSNEQTARLCGVRVQRTKLLIYVFAGFFAGIAGLLQFSRLSGMGDPTTANGYELAVIAAVVIGGCSLTGGEGGVAGTLIGALIMRVVANGCQKMLWSNSIQEIVTGGIIILAVVLDRLRHRRSA